ncbi:von Willebrand factor type A domain protein [Rubripirellula tenax]|uniref:von Willebrand factor type A domain protein n=1 Tax=Rubripirellula tenax TaxID=2528015 RepID=A0A5C6FG60_9BACT|nr:VWA domain-containing protein [Rubripirellula tenax]TWU58581.1 von Willebrand factor type A domain protein [Rubripirellula tenax]
MMEFLDAFHFLRPWWLLAILPVTLLGWWMIRRDDPTGDLKHAIAPHLLRPLTISPASSTRFRPAMMAVPLWTLSVLALAGPTWRTEPPPWTEDESSLYLVVRMTPSMISEDVQPNRLERARGKLHDLMELRRGSRTGLIVYSQSAHLVMPATDDSGVIDQMLQSLDPAMMPGEGDALADALRMASDHIESSGRGGSVLIVADGNEPAQASSLAGWRTTTSTPVQWLAPVPVGSSLDAIGITTAAGSIAAATIAITPDDTDVNAIARRAEQTFAMAAIGDASQWRDEGIWLVWPVAMGLAIWFRKGWSVTP